MNTENSHDWVFVYHSFIVSPQHTNINFKPSNNYVVKKQTFSFNARGLTKM